jgi:hypothetical protein
VLRVFLEKFISSHIITTLYSTNALRKQFNRILFFLKEDEDREEADQAAARACPSSCTDTEIKVEISKYPASASDMLKPETYVRRRQSNR